MPITYQIDTAEKIVYLIVSDSLTYDEWEAAFLAVFSDPSYRPGFDLLSDRRGQREPPTTAMMRRAAEFLSRYDAFVRGSRWAMVSDVNSVHGMLRMFAVYAEGAGLTAVTFRDYDEARRWLLSGRGPEV